MNERVSAERRSAGPNVTEFSDRQCEMNECVSILIQIFVIDNKRDQVMCRVLENHWLFSFHEWQTEIV